MGIFEEPHETNGGMPTYSELRKRNRSCPCDRGHRADHEPAGNPILNRFPGGKPQSALTATRRDLIIDLAARFRLPAIYSFGFYAESGGLVSYGINQLEQARPAASYVDQILRGANAGDLPVQLPLKYELVINIKTAVTLGLTVHNSLQLLADHVIE